MMLSHGVCGLRRGFSDWKMQPGGGGYVSPAGCRSDTSPLARSPLPPRPFEPPSSKLEIPVLALFCPGLHVGFNSSRGMIADPSRGVRDDSVPLIWSSVHVEDIRCRLDFPVQAFWECEV